ncbi:PTS sugar transporter subunit IIA [Afipia sp. P52-10]|jgi:PTS system nitrogen regulatory IIA component|uniref:PTS sugar transporter subunit IIA n=1 Tax=Afipia sp. P52-10 TaxID=1429916 RepID=UPI0003DF271B|nr:PTS sugar transporter subunit IIA [Afipia sp. P52-10]ETR77751.1 PTS sugar transporter subunit IIA [Afipia sp. P52-10]
MIISEFLAERDVLLDLAVADKAALLQRLAAQAAATLEAPSAEIAAALFAREALGSTGTGSGVAVPHARLRRVTRPLGAFARMRQAIAFDAIDDAPVDLVFLLLLPKGNEGRHLSALAAVARKLRNPDMQASLRRARSQAELYAAICL